MRLIFIVALASFFSCGRDSLTAPAAAFALSGRVTDAAGRSLPQTRVEALDGSRKGAAAATDDGGRFEFPSIFTGRFALQASRAGYRAQVKSIASAQSDASFALDLNLVGSYEVTFAADDVCTNLPLAARSRTYWASVALSNSVSYVATLSGADFVKGSGSYPDSNVLYVSVAKDTAHVFFGDPPVWEHLTRETDRSRASDLLVNGDVSGAIQFDRSSWPFAGTFTYCAAARPDEYLACDVPEIVCRSAHHRFTLERH